MRIFKDIYSPTEVRTEDEIKEWIKQHRNSIAGEFQSTKRIVTRHVSRLREVHTITPYLKGGYTGAQGHHGKVYFWIGLTNSDKMYNVGWDID